MKTLAGIFNSPLHAHRARFRLRTSGFKKTQVTILRPATSAVDLGSTPTADGEQPGMGIILGAVTGGAAGVWVALIIVALPVSSFIFGAESFFVIAMGLFGSAAGVVGGALLESRLIVGLPRDELYYYGKELKHGCTVLVLRARGRRQIREGRIALVRSGARGLNAARKTWWVGLRRA